MHMTEIIFREMELIFRMLMCFLGDCNVSDIPTTVSPLAYVVMLMESSWCNHMALRGGGGIIPCQNCIQVGL